MARKTVRIPAVSDDRILVIREEPIDKTEGGLIIPDEAVDELVTIGTIEASGPQSSYTKGEKIVFTRFAGVTLKIDGEEFLVLRDSDVVGVFGPKEGRIGYRHAEQKRDLT